MSTHGPGSLIPRSAVVIAFLAAAGCSGVVTETGEPAAQQQGVTVSVAPPVASLGPRAQQAFEAAVTGTVDASVTWRISEAGCGTVSAGGLYTAPAAAATCHVIVTSSADPSKSAAAVVTVGAVSPPPGGSATWAPLKVGAGGWVTGLDIDPTGTTYLARTDTYGAYVGNGTGPWKQVINAASMPASFLQSMTQGRVQTLGSGVYEIRVAPSDANRLYMIFQGKVYKSVNRGTSWTLTASTYDAGNVDANDPSGSRYYGEKMAVDPINPDVVYAGSSTGLWLTTNGGTSWALVPTASVPAPTLIGGSGFSVGFTGVAFDPGSGSTGGRTNTVFACSNGRGIYRSTNAGASWAQVSGGPTEVSHAVVDQTGAYWVASETPAFRKYAGGAWTTHAPGARDVHLVIVNPANPSHVLAASDPGYFYVSTNGGATWTDSIEPAEYGGPGVIRVATDIPWLAAAQEIYMSNGAMRFDPVVPNKVWFGEGIGVWTATAPTSYAPVTWTSHSAGIEQLVGRDLCVPPGSAYVFTAGMDRSVFRVSRSNTSYPADYLRMGSSESLIPAWAVDYSAANPSHLVAIINYGPELSGYSLDGGSTWTKFPVQPGAGGGSGDIVATSIDNIIAVIGTMYAYRSTNRGASWTKLTLPGDGGANTSNLHGGYNHKKHILAIDGADPRTIYLYFFSRGLYRSTNDGATWSLVTNNAFDGDNMYWQTKLHAVPGQAGHLFLTAGQAGGDGSQNPSETSLWRSTNGGVTWTTVPGMQEPYDVALGKAAPGATYPAIYVVGWYNGQYGVWRSNDNAATWTNLDQFPFDSIDEINRIVASQDTYGEVYVAFNGSGYGKLMAP